MRGDGAGGLAAVEVAHRCHRITIQVQAVSIIVAAPEKLLRGPILEQLLNMGSNLV